MHKRKKFKQTKERQKKKFKVNDIIKCSTYTKINLKPNTQ